MATSNETVISFIDKMQYDEKIISYHIRELKECVISRLAPIIVGK